jgi:hypothetical protein
MSVCCVSKPFTTFCRQDLARRIHLDSVKAIMVCLAAIAEISRLLAESASLDKRVKALKKAKSVMIA